MTYIVEIRRNETGDVRSLEEPHEWDGDYIWTDGNYSCDCNRALFFARVAGEEDPDIPCSEHLYAIRITLPDGRIPVDEFSQETSAPQQSSDAKDL